MKRWIATGMPLCLSLLISELIFAQDKTAAIDQVFSWATPATPGCVCAVSQHGQTIYQRAVGSADLERQVPLTVDAVFDAGSLSKQFVAAAALLLVEDKRLALTDDVHRYVPELPDYGHRITIDHLLTHTSGLRDWTGIVPLMARPVDAFTLMLRQRGLQLEPGSAWEYSNGGFVLMKEIIKRVSKEPVSTFFQKRLFEPLGMRHTSYREDLRETIPNRAQAYDKEDGRWKTAMLLENDRGGGGALFTTASDLLIWNEALANNKLGAFVTAKLQEPARLNNGRSISYGRGLLLESYRGAKEIWHSGSAAGYKGWLGRYPEHGLSIAILCNSGDGTNRVAFAHKIFDLLVPGAPPAQSGAPAPVTDSTTLASINQKAGLYFQETTGDPLRLSVDGNRFRIAGGPGLVPVTTDRFKRLGAFVQFMSQDAFELHWVSNDVFELKSMEGAITRYRRATVYAPTPEQLEVFAGRYESDEAGSVFIFTPGAGGLQARMEHVPERSVPFRPVAPDVFQAGGMTVRFVRDKQGQVSGLDYSNPVVRHIAFKKLAEAAGRK